MPVTSGYRLSRAIPGPYLVKTTHIGLAGPVAAKHVGRRPDARPDPASGWERA